MSDKDKLPLTEELDFAYLLELMPPLYNVPEFSWLPELFSIIGHERLLKLCKYAGGEKIEIPTLTQLSSCMEVLQLFYDVHITKKKSITEVPVKHLPLFMKVVDIYSARNS